MDIRFENRNVLITGAARGIGRGIVSAFLKSGATVFATDILDEQLADLERELTTIGDLRCRTLDVTDAAMIKARVEEIERSGGVDILVHVAGGVLGQSHQPVENVTEDQWDAIYDVNVKGAFLVAAAVVPGMKVRGSGRIVIVSSGAGLTISMTGIQAYASSKAAQLSLVRQLGFELGPFGINVNAIAPGFLRTSPDYERQWAAYGEEGQAAIMQQIPMRRLGHPDDIASATLFLSSDNATWITGQVLSVNGGHN